MHFENEFPSHSKCTVVMGLVEVNLKKEKNKRKEEKKTKEND